jgi:metal-sulfur cluster biosynthetic enzyme
MDAAMKEKIDNVLDTVKEPETGLTMAQLGFVERIRYSEKQKKLTVFSCNLKANQKLCCTVIQGLLISGTKNALTEAFQKAFPDLAVEVV